MCPTPFPGIFLKNQGKCQEILELYRGYSICAAQFIELFITKKKIFSSVGDSALSRTALHELFFISTNYSTYYPELIESSCLMEILILEVIKGHCDPSLSRRFSAVPNNIQLELALSRIALAIIYRLSAVLEGADSAKNANIFANFKKFS